MSIVLYRDIDALVIGDKEGTVLRNVNLLCDGGVITNIGPGLVADHATNVDCSGLTVYPGLVNTHHHFFQAFVRNITLLDWTQLDVLTWLDSIYPVFSLMNEDCIYHSTVVSIAELIKHGCTTAFDHQYNYSRNAGTYLIDRQFEAAQLFGMRFIAGRGCNTLPKSEGSTVPEDMLETTDEFLVDCERLINRYHDPAVGSMAQVAVAPCQPINAYAETFVLAAELARSAHVRLHTHLGEGENAGMLARFGQRSLDWCEKIGFVGKDVWLAHGWEFTQDEITRLAKQGTGISHCPAPVFLVGAQVTDIPAMVEAGVNLGLGVDGHASNDNSNLAQCIRMAYQLQCLTAKQRQYAVPTPYDFFRMATNGGADCLGRSDIGELKIGKSADFFGVNLGRIEYVGANHDVLALPAKVGFSGPVDLTVINGKVVWRNGEFSGLDEAQLVAEAHSVFSQKILRADTAKMLFL